MEDFKQKFEDAILKLNISEEKKQEFLEKLRTEGVSIGLVESLKQAVSDKIRLLEIDTQNKVDALQAEVEQATKDLSDEVGQIQSSANEELKRLEAEASQKQVDDLRSKISAM